MRERGNDMKTAWMAIVLGMIVGSASAGGEGWLTDFDAAKKLAAEKNVPILADFSGSDWCGWCIKLDKEVFQKDNFKTYAKDNVVLFLADFPNKGKQTDAVKKQNKGLAETYKVQGFPTVLLLGADGKVLGRTGYKPGGPDAYITHVKSLLAAE
ncbi:MAG: thioredoxin-related protein [Candidatus Promineifilaceae bacterium]|jgi:thioredoxin-related protein